MKLINKNSQKYNSLKMRRRGRKKPLKDGYYIEVKNQNQKDGVKIRRDTLNQLRIAIEKYSINKDVEIIGQMIKGKIFEIKI